MTSYNELREGQDFFANGYKKGYEDAKKEFESNITQAISEELEALPKGGDELLLLAMFGACIRFNILRKLEKGGEKE